MSDPQTAETEAISAELDAADVQNDSVENGTTAQDSDSVTQEVSEPDQLEDDSPEENEPEGTPMVPTHDVHQVPVGPIVVDEVDRLKAENYNLKLLNVMNREAVAQGNIKELQGSIKELHGQRSELMAQMQALRVDLEARYGIDLNTHHIVPESGVVMPRQPTAPGTMDPAAVAAAVQQLQANAKG